MINELHLSVLTIYNNFIISRSKPEACTTSGDGEVESIIEIVEGCVHYDYPFRKILFSTVLFSWTIPYFSYYFIMKILFYCSIQ